MHPMQRTDQVRSVPRARGRAGVRLRGNRPLRQDLDATPTARWHLGRGADRSKDQSYVLHVLGQKQLGRSLFPVGGQAKAETRAHAERLGLPVAGKPDSQEVCFVPGADHAEFLERPRPGSGPAGRRRRCVRAGSGPRTTEPSATRSARGRGLGVSTGERSYVVEMDRAANRVVVGPGELLARRGLRGGPRHLGGRALHHRARSKPRFGSGTTARMSRRWSTGRARGRRVEFRTPQRGVAPGQSVVFYRGRRGPGRGPNHGVDPT